MSVPKNDEQAVRAIIRGLVKAGFILDSVNDGDELVDTKTEKAAMEAIFAVDSATLVVKHPDKDKYSGVFFVLGNSREEVAADWHISLDDAISSVVNPWWE